MQLDDLRDYCLSKPEAEETTPFGPDALVYKLNGKVFSILPLTADRLSINLKCDPDYAIELRDEHEDIIPGFHMNKKHWNTVYADGSLKPQMIKKLIDHSYELIRKSIKSGKK